MAMEQQSLAVILHRAEADIAAALRQHDSLVLMKSTAASPALCCWRRRAAGCADDVRATLPGEQCWRRLREVSDDQPLPYFSTILVNKQWRRRNESGEIAEAASYGGWRPLFC